MYFLTGPYLIFTLNICCVVIAFLFGIFALPLHVANKNLKGKGEIKQQVDQSGLKDPENRKDLPEENNAMLNTGKGIKPSSALHYKLWSFIITGSIFSTFFCLFFIFTGKPIFSAVITDMLYLVLVLINNAKYRSLNEPLLFSDYDYFTDAFRFPRLYFPFLGIAGFLGIVLAAGLIILGWCSETYINDLRFSGSVIALVLCILFISLGILYKSKKKPLIISFNPVSDLKKYGFPTFTWLYFLAYMQKPEAVSPFAEQIDKIKQIEQIEQIKEEKKPTENMQSDKETAEQKNTVNCVLSAAELPCNIIAVQSESFFDPRTLVKGINSEILQDFDRIRQESFLSGSLTVPAFGANTIRTEFSFLTGISPSEMLGHQFSPYQISARNWQTANLVSFLKAAGYYTVCIHPYYSQFYHRNKIFKKWGFDKFIDISDFDLSVIKPKESGPYVPDAVLMHYIQQTYLQVTAEQCNSREQNKSYKEKPVFIFVITMENHGPLDLEQITLEEEKSFFVQNSKNSSAKSNCEVNINKQGNQETSSSASSASSESLSSYRDLAVYIRHLVHENNMLRDLTSWLNERKEPVSLTFYGDHVPILPDLYKYCGLPDGRVPFFIWQNNAEKVMFNMNMNGNNICSAAESGVIRKKENLSVETLAMHIPGVARLTDSARDTEKKL